MFHSYIIILIHSSLSSYDFSSELFIYDVVTLVSSVKCFMGSAFQTKHTFLQLFSNDFDNNRYLTQNSCRSDALQNKLKKVYLI
jgi:hypothetical protein